MAADGRALTAGQVFRNRSLEVVLVLVALALSRLREDVRDVMNETKVTSSSLKRFGLVSWTLRIPHESSNGPLTC
ncbi:hypothetical protein [Natrinema gelatinilyticum]|uniref:hypothetical protein n=1 Tax=Natrinema gelatinilyticum TaxID=2961571 RepID=UPI0020C20227|nr:hypothetical protein [Natrinema gelatinilyticum]